MRKGSFLLLLGVTVLMVAAALQGLLSGDRAVSPAIHAQRMFPHLAARLGDLAWMRLSHGKMKADFAEIGNHWEIVEKGNYPAASGKVRRLLLGLADLTLIEPKTTRPALFARLGLDDPKNGKSTLVTLQDRTGNTVAAVIVGKTRHDRLGAGNDGVYVRRPDDNRTWLARGSLDLPDSLTGWLDRRILDIAEARIAAVTLTGSDGTALVLRRAAPGGKFAVADAPADTKFKDPAALAKPAAALADLQLDDVKPAADLAVPQSGVATASFTTFDGLTIKLRLLTRDNVDWVALEAVGNGKEAADAKALDANVARWTYAIPAERAKLLRTRLGDLVAPAKGS